MNENQEKREPQAETGEQQNTVTEQQGEGQMEEKTALSQETATATESEEQDSKKLNISVDINDIGSCRKHVAVRIPREEIDRISQEVITELREKVDIPGFRKGHAPTKLVAKRFRREIADELKQKLLLQSLEQLADEYKLDPIDEPDLDVEAIEVPEEGDFEYEFEVEVRPEFELPQYKGLKIKRKVREISDEDVEKFRQMYLFEFARYEPTSEPAQVGDIVVFSAKFYKDGQLVRELEDEKAHVRPVLRFQDAEIQDFDKLMEGARKGDVRECDVTISQEALVVGMRGQKLHVRFEIKEVYRAHLPDSQQLRERLGVETEEELRYTLSDILERRLEFLQREYAREQVLEQITELAEIELPESFVAKQVENAIYREILELRQAGFSEQEILARENELRQRAITETQKAIKQHFVLDEIATKENIEVTPQDIEERITLMAMNVGESPRRLRARLAKSGLLENLEAQTREQKTVEFILEHAQFEDEPIELEEVIGINQQVAGVPVAICENLPSVKESKPQQSSEKQTENAQTETDDDQTTETEEKTS